MIAGFHEVRFPCGLTPDARGGPEWMTEIVGTRSGDEERNQRWYGAKHRWNAGYGLNTIEKIAAVRAFFNERKGRFYGFRWFDRFDCTSGATLKTPIAATDQTLGVGTGAQTAFQLIKTYGSAFAPWARKIVKPVAGTTLVAIDGVTQASGWSIDTTTGVITFVAPPAMGAVVAAGYKFDVPVRFDIDFLEIDERSVSHGAIPNIPVIELLDF